MPEPIPVQPLLPLSTSVPTETPAPSSDDTPPGTARRRFHINPRLLGKKWRKRTRWFFRIVLGGPLLLLIVLLILVRSPLVGYIARSAIEPLLGCKLSHSGAVISLDGRLIVDDLSLRVPGLAGQAGEFVHARRAEVDLDWSGIMRGEVRPTGVRLFEPVFRVSQSTTTGSVNLAELHPGTTPSRFTQPPRIDVLDGAIEFGEHTPSGSAGTSTGTKSKKEDPYRQLTRMDIAGTLAPVDAARPSYLIRFHENLAQKKPAVAATVTTASTPASSIGMVLDGKVDLESSKVSARLLNVRIDGWPPDSVPTYLRDIWTRLDIHGRMPETSISYDPATGPEVEVKLDGVTMSALIPTTAPGGKSDDTLKLRGVVGTIKFAGSTLSAELDAVVATQTVPSHVSLQYQGLTADAPLHCVITTKAFRLDKDPAWLVFTPIQVKENLAAFCGPTGLIDGIVTIDRGPPGPQGPAELTVNGSLDLSNGTAAFHRVPYPFKNITSHFSFDQNKISIDHLEGSSDSGATIEATGWIAPPNDDAEISLHIVVHDIPLDHTFAESLPASRKGAVSFLLSDEKYDALRAAKLISSPADRVPVAPGSPTSPERERVGPANRANTPLPDGRGSLSLEHPSLDAPEFTLGGLAELDITVHSPPGKHAPWTYTVQVLIPRAGFLASAFPWPVNATDVHVELTESHAELLAGTFKGLRGGELDLAAYVILETNGEADLKPDLHVRATDLPIDDLLLFALPGAETVHSPSESEPGYPLSERGATQIQTQPPSSDSPVAAALRKLKLQGRLNCIAAISPTPENDLALTMDLGFANLTAGPFDTSPGESISLQRLSGRLKLNQAVVEIPFIQGTLISATNPNSYGDFHLAADAHLTHAPQLLMRPGETSKPASADTTSATSDAPATGIHDVSASLDLINVDVAVPVEALARLFSQSAADQITQLRAPLDPRGRIDATVTLTMNAPDEAAAVAAELHAARGLELTVQDIRLSIDTPFASNAPQGSVAYITHIDSLLPVSEPPAESVAPSSTTTTAKPVQPAQSRAGAVPDLIEFRDFRAGVASDSDAPLTLRANGTLAVGSDSPTPAMQDSTAQRITLDIENAQLESCLVRTLLNRAVSSETASTVDSLDPHGLFDAAITLTAKSSSISAAVSSPPPSTSAASSDAPTPASSMPFDAAGTITPRSVSLSLDGSKLESNSILGSISFDGSGVHTHGLALIGPDWSLALQGGRLTRGDGSTQTDLGVWAHAAGLTPAIRALLPKSVRAQLDDAKLAVAGPIEITSARLTQSSPAVTLATATSPSPATHLVGSFTFAGLSVDSALAVQEASGAVELKLDRAVGESAWKFDASLRGDRMIVSGLAMNSLVARIVSGATPGEIIVPAAQADCYGGRITGSGLIGPALVESPEIARRFEPGNGPRRFIAEPPPPPRGYAANVSLAGIRFAPLLEAFGTPTPPIADTPTSPPTPTPPVAERGSVDAGLTFSGIFGEPDSRQGLGSIRISGGDVVRMPLVLALLQLSNFQIPAEDSLDYFQARFRLSGGYIDFDQIALLSRTLAITGYGNMTWPGKELDLRFNSRANDRVPLVSDVIEAVRNEVLTTRVQGTLMNPAIDAETLTGTKRMIDNAIGKDAGPTRSTTEAQSDKTARAERDRIKNPKPNPPTSPESERP